ncbi:nuclear speckle splicing regulatory protein 1-like isoform X2 [Gigantopelta aegis]|nr:nuclear speckle splicing regulatory protein 1-like isoform X2 [Gigantopelta aegis]
MQLKINQTKVKKQTQMEIDKALSEDPNVYEYDSIYDNIVASKSAACVKNTTPANEKKPKYITGLLKAAEVRKREEEKRMERKVQKEREEEGDKYDDKEAFVTSAYKKKMLEMQEQEEKERQVAAMEEMLDVTKQKDMSGFYRYLYRETTGSVTIKETHPDESDKDVKKEPAADCEPNRGDSDSSESECDRRSPQNQKAQSNLNHREGKRREHSRSEEREIIDTTQRSRSRERRKRSRSVEKRSRSRSLNKKSEERRQRSRSLERSKHSRSSGQRKLSSSQERNSKNRGKLSADGRNRSRSTERRKRKHRSRSVERKHRSRSVERKHRSRSVERKHRLRSRDRHSSDVINITSDRSFDQTAVSDNIDKNIKDSNTESSAVNTENNLNTKETDDAQASDNKHRVDVKSKYTRRTTDSAVEEAKKRYLARKLEKLQSRPVEEG